MSESPNADRGWQERALDLIDHIRLVVDEIPGASTRSKLLQAASSVSWQIQWDRRHPSHNGSSGAS